MHRDFHVEVAQGAVLGPEHLIGQRIQARADDELVKLFHRGQLVKTHPRQQPGRRSTDPADLPAAKAAYALRDLQRLIAAAAGHGPNVGIYAERLLDDDAALDQDAAGLPAARAGPPLRPRPGRHRLLRGRSTSTSSPSPRSPPCSNAPPRTPRHRRRRAASGISTARFARDPAEYKRATPSWLTVIDGGAAGQETQNDHQTVVQTRSHRPEAGAAAAQARPDARHPARAARPGQTTTPLPRRVPRTRPRRRGHPPRHQLGGPTRPHRRARPRHAARHLGRHRRGPLRPRPCGTS